MWFRRWFGAGKEESSARKDEPIPERDSSTEDKATYRTRIAERERGKLQSQIDSIQEELRRLRKRTAPAKSADEKEEDENEGDEEEPRRLNWKEDFNDLVWDDDDDTNKTVKELRADLINGLVNSVEEPSLYLLVSTRQTFGSGGYRQCPRVNFTAVWVGILYAALLFISIVLPFCLLPIIARQVPFFSFESDLDGGSDVRSKIHRGFLRFSATFLLFYLFYTALSILDEVRAFRFFLLADLASKRPASFSDPWNHPLIPKEKHPLSRRHLKFAIAFKLVSLFAVFAVTYLIYRTDFTPTSIVLNSVALQFILAIDKSIVASMKNQPALRRFYARAVEQLRERADEVVLENPDTVRAICEPMLLGTPELFRISANTDSLDDAAGKVKEAAQNAVDDDGPMSSHGEASGNNQESAEEDEDEAPSSPHDEEEGGAPEKDEKEETYDNLSDPDIEEKQEEKKKPRLGKEKSKSEMGEKKQQKEEEEKCARKNLRKLRIGKSCTRSELLHRLISKFVYFIGFLMVAFQLVGSLVCGGANTCSVPL